MGPELEKPVTCYFKILIKAETAVWSDISRCGVVLGTHFSSKTIVKPSKAHSVGRGKQRRRKVCLSVHLHFSALTVFTGPTLPSAVRQKDEG